MDGVFPSNDVVGLSPENTRRKSRSPAYLLLEGLAIPIGDLTAWPHVTGLIPAGGG